MGEFSVTIQKGVSSRILKVWAGSVAFVFVFIKKIEKVYRHTLTVKININPGRINELLMKIVTNRRQKGAGNSRSDKD